MKGKEFIFVGLCTAFIVLFFFHKTIIKGYIPFPGDLLVGHYEPYKSYPFLGYAPGAIPHKAQGPDVIKQLFPWKYFTIVSWKRLEISFWNPHNFSGNPHMANFQSGVFYPLNTVFFIAAFHIGWTIFILFIPFLAMFFTYLLLREFGVSRIASLYGGAVFAFSSYMVVWIEYGNIGHTLLWLPLQVFLAEKLLKKFQTRVFIGLILAFFVAILAGYIQGYFYSMLFVVFYVLARLFLQKDLTFKRIFIFILAFMLPPALSLFQILPTLELFQYSTRGNYSLEDIQKLLNPFYYTITTIVPDFFGNPASRNHWFFGTYIERVSYFGLLPFIFALFAIFYHRAKKEVVIFGIVFIVAFLASLDLLITKYFYAIPIPVISTTVPTRILSLFVFCGSVLAGIGLDPFIKNLNKQTLKRLAYITLLILVVLGFCWLFTFTADKTSTFSQWSSHLTVARRNLILPTLYILLFSALLLYIFYFKKSRTFLISGVLFLTIFDLFYFFQKITPFSSPSLVYPSTPVISYIQSHASIDRFWGYGSGYIESNFQTYDKTFSPEGYDPLHIKSYTELVSASKDGAIPANLPRPDTNIAPGFGPRDLRENQYRQKILNVLGVKYILHKNDLLGKDWVADEVTFDNKTYKLIWQNAPWQVYENKKVAPRTFLTDKYIVVKNKKETINMLLSKTFDESSEIILSEQPKLSKGQLANSSLELLSYEPNRVILKTETNTDALLFLSDNYYPGWRAFVDNAESKIYRANYTFRAVVVPRGNHQVSFVYFPRSFQNGLVLSGISFILLISAIFGLKKARYEVY